MRRLALACALGIAVILIILPSAAGATGRHGHGTVVVASRGSVVVVPRSSVVVVSPARPHVFVGARVFVGPRGFHRFGCCFGPAFVGGVFVGSALAYPNYAYPYPYPVYYPEPVYVPAPAYQPQLSVAPSIQREVCYVGGCYRLQGDGVTVAYRWVWIPTVPEPPPAPPTAPPAGPPAPSGLVPADPASSHPTQQLYRWIDEQGVATWTNSGEAVPDRYRTPPKRSLSF